MLKSAPNREQFLGLAGYTGGPVVMLNLLKFEGEVSGGGGESATGPELYARYSEVAKKHIEACGGRVLWQGTARFHLVGSERWDVVLLVEYPSVQAFMRMQNDPEYRESLRHRERGLADTRVIACETVGLDGSTP